MNALPQPHRTRSLNNNALPSIPELLNNPACSTWLRTALQGVLFGGRDPCDAARDAQLLADVFDARAKAIGEVSASQTYYDGCRAPMADLLLPLVGADQAEGLIRTEPVSLRTANGYALHAR
jgi:hypothetical protein